MTHPKHAIIGHIRRIDDRRETTLSVCSIMQVDRSLYWGILDHFLFCIYQSLFILDIVKNKLSLKELTESNLPYNHLLDILQFVKDINLIFQAEIDLVNNNNQKFWNKVWETVFKREYTKGTTNKFCRFLILV